MKINRINFWCSSQLSILLISPPPNKLCLVTNILCQVNYHRLSVYLSLSNLYILQLYTFCSFIFPSVSNFLFLYLTASSNCSLFTFDKHFPFTNISFYIFTSCTSFFHPFFTFSSTLPFPPLLIRFSFSTSSFSLPFPFFSLHTEMYTHVHNYFLLFPFHLSSRITCTIKYFREFWTRMAFNCILTFQFP